MNAIALCFGGALKRWAFESAFDGASAFERALGAAASFPGVTRVALLAGAGFDGRLLPGLPVPCDVIRAAAWDTVSYLEALSRASEGFDAAYVAWADCPFLDAALAAALLDRHAAFPAEYTYADGWPYGLSPELFAPGVLGVLARLAGGARGPVTRTTLFDTLQKDINAFDIETEIAPLDMRSRRISLCADTKRNLLLLRRFREAGFAGYEDAGRVLAEHPRILRTLPAYVAVQVSTACPQDCPVCPYPRFSGADKGGAGFMPAEVFDALAGRVEDFAGEAVVGISLWGEPALHPAAGALAASVLARPGLSLLIETSGLGWKEADLALIEKAAREEKEKRGEDALWWVVSLDAADASEYRKARGEGFERAAAFAGALAARFPGAVYAQAVRRAGAEADVERFYKYWKDKGAGVIIQKYDGFCGKMPPLLACDISPVTREPCWHLERDMCVLADGRVLACREDVAGIAGEPELAAPGASPGAAFNGDLAALWERGAALYAAHCDKDWRGLCAACDEYYTFNF